MKITAITTGWICLLVLCLITPGVMAADTTGVTDNEIKIGTFSVFTGPASAAGIAVYDPLITMVNLANEAGGIHGRKIKMFLEDDACNPEKAKSAVKKLIYDTKVFALVGGGCSLAAYGAKMEIEAAKVPWLCAPSVMDKIYVPVVRTTFGWGLTSSIDALSMSRFILTKPGIKRIAFVYHYDEWGKGLLESAESGLKNSQVEWITEVMDKGVTDATPVVLKIKKYNPDAVLGFLFPAEGAVFVRDAYKYGLSVPIIFNTGCNDLTDLRVRSGIPESMKWVFASTYGIASIGDPRFADLIEAYKKYYPQDKPQAYNFIGFAGGKILIEVLKRAGRDLTREKFLDTVENLKDFDTGLLSSKISFSKTIHTGLKNCIFVTLKKDGTEYYMDKLAWDPDILKKKGWE